MANKFIILSFDLTFTKYYYKNSWFNTIMIN